MILIGVPCYRTIHVRTADSIIRTLLANTNTNIGFMNGVFVHQNQNNLVEMAKERNASHIFFVEHDMVFAPDTLNRLLEHNKDIVAASYSGRALPREPLVYQQNPINKEIYQMSYDRWPDKLFKAYGIPTGCTLIKISVFDKLEKPYFFYKYNKEGVMESSQDIYFSKKANEAGLECWVDPTIEINHIGDYDY